MEGKDAEADHRTDELMCLHAAALAALSHLPVHCIACVAGKRKVQPLPTPAAGLCLAGL